MTESPTELLARLQSQIDAACTAGARPQWNLPLHQTDAFRAVSREMLVLKKLAEDNIKIEVVETAGQ
jgi:hypothetical protein